MAKIKAYVHLQDPDGRRVILAKGEEIPEWAVVDEALIERPDPPKKKFPAKKKAPAKKAVTQTVPVDPAPEQD